jgi:hypothetical protein
MLMLLAAARRLCTCAQYTFAMLQSTIKAIGNNTNEAIISRNDVSTIGNNNSANYTNTTIIIIIRPAKTKRVSYKCAGPSGKHSSSHGSKSRKKSATVSHL